MERVLIMKRTDMSDLEGLVYIFKTTDYNMDIIQRHLKKKNTWRRRERSFTGEG